MSKVLAACFSASGVTKKFAEELARIEKADFFDIQPETPYTAADLDWKDQQARSTLEMKDLNCRPAVVGTVEKGTRLGGEISEKDLKTWTAGLGL